MTGTLSRIVTDRLGNVVMIVHPDFDRQLSDPAFAPAGTQQFDVARTAYQGMDGTRRGFLVLLQQKATDLGRVLLAAIFQKRIDLIDALIEAQAGLALWQQRLEQWPTPTQAQQLLINAAHVQYLQDLQNIQDIRDSTAVLEGQVP